MQFPAHLPFEYVVNSIAQLFVSLSIIRSSASKVLRDRKQGRECLLSSIQGPTLFLFFFNTLNFFQILAKWAEDFEVLHSIRSGSKVRLS